MNNNLAVRQCRLGSLPRCKRRKGSSQVVYDASTVQAGQHTLNLNPARTPARQCGYANLGRAWATPSAPYQVQHHTSAHLVQDIYTSVLGRTVPEIDVPSAPGGGRVLEFYIY